MPKRSDTSRTKQSGRANPSEHPPAQEDVERAIAATLDRLAPKGRRPPKTDGLPARKT
ncbi:hypothetical protein [Methylobacterium planeticum]|uniref:hypothetical protein n=1 Tax=Methylobacterium planeticum TaxID=2615211 RepID=UPI00177EBE58|nr:hypothetical protein [Methylobacterium planeticum]